MSSMEAVVPSFMGVPMKHISLVTLCFQNSGLILIMHYSRIMHKRDSDRYLTSTAVFLNEVIKLLICILVALRDRQKLDGSSSTLATNIRGLWAEVFKLDSWKLAIPAALYTFQNTLQYVAVSNLDAATFQVTYQLKIITTALFSVTILHRQLAIHQWISLFLLTAGIAIVQIPTNDSPKHDEPEVGEPQMDKALGLIAVTIACTISGLAGVYFEKVLKGSSTTLWVRNIQLSFYSLFPAFFLGVVLKDSQQILERGFFHGYNVIVWTAIGFQAAGGIVVALCVNYADNIAKNFATSISILLSSIASIYFFNFHLSFFFAAGSSIVLFATFLYSKPETPKKEPVVYIPLDATRVDEDSLNPSPHGRAANVSSNGDLGDPKRYD